MTISPGWRLFLYVMMSILPVWVDFFKNSQDFSFRGLMNPLLNSMYAAVVVTLAKTAPTNDDTDTQNVKVINKPGDPVPTTQSVAIPSKKGTSKL